MEQLQDQVPPFESIMAMLQETAQMQKESDMKRSDTGLKVF